MRLRLFCVRRNPTDWFLYKTKGGFYSRKWTAERVLPPPLFSRILPPPLLKKLTVACGPEQISWETLLRNDGAEFYAHSHRYAAVPFRLSSISPRRLVVRKAPVRLHPHPPVRAGGVGGRGKGGLWARQILSKLGNCLSQTVT